MTATCAFASLTPSRPLLLTALCLFGFAALPATVNAMPELDTTFSDDGVAITDFDPNDEPEQDSDRARDMAVDSEGRVILAGGGPGGGAVVRYATDGSLDESFAGDGVLLAEEAPFLGAGETLRGVAVQDDDRILVSGEQAGSLIVARLTEDGSLDESFSNNGVAHVAGQAGERSLEVLDDGSGKIVALGARYSATRTDRLLVARFDADGTRDSSFAGDGVSLVAPPAASIVPYTPDLAVGRNGRIVIAGRALHGDQWELVVLRLTDEGAPDSSFSQDGWRWVGFAGYGDGNAGYWDDDHSGVAIGPGSTITVVGSLITRFDIDPLDVDMAVARLHRNGTFDEGFSGDGRRTLSFGDDWAEARSVGLLPGGRTLVAGAAGGFVAAVLSPTGNPVSSFSGNGRSRLRFTKDASVESLAVLPDGRFVLAGSNYQSESGDLGQMSWDYDFAVARYDAVD